MNHLLLSVFIGIFFFQNLFASQIKGCFKRDDFWSDTLYLDKVKSLDKMFNTSSLKSYFGVINDKGCFSIKLDKDDVGCLFRLRLKPKNENGVSIFNNYGYRNNIYPLVIENENVNIIIEADLKNFFSTISITGNKLNQGILSSLKIVRDRIFLEELLVRKSDSSRHLDSKTQDSIQKTSMTIYLTRLQDDFKKIMKFSFENPNELISTCILLQYNSYEMFLESEEVFFKEFINRLGLCESQICRSFVEKYQKILSKNFASKDFVPLSRFIPSVDSSKAFVTDKYILLDFWASWCKPCRFQNRTSLQKIHKQFNDKLMIISISIEQDKDLWLKAKKEDRIIWESYFLPQQDSKPLKDYYLIEGFPTYHLFSPDGKAIKWFLTSDEVENIGRFIK